MVLIDTSVWVDHFKRSNDELSSLLEEDQVLIHEFVIGELACGGLKNRAEILKLLQELPQATPARHEEALDFARSHRLHGKGIGWIDVHLLASSKLSQAKLWTLDKKLAAASAALGILY